MTPEFSIALVIFLVLIVVVSLSYRCIKYWNQ